LLLTYAETMSAVNSANSAARVSDSLVIGGPFV
jgi:hypothetical protein